MILKLLNKLLPKMRKKWKNYHLMTQVYLLEKVTLDQSFLLFYPVYKTFKISAGLTDFFIYTLYNYTIHEENNNNNKIRGA